MDSIDDLLIRLRSEQPAMPDAEQLTERILTRMPRQKPCSRSRMGLAAQWVRVISSMVAVFLVLLYLFTDGHTADQTPPVPARRREVSEIRFCSKEDACTYYIDKLNRVHFGEQLKTMYYESK